MAERCGSNAEPLPALPDLPLGRGRAHCASLTHHRCEATKIAESCPESQMARTHSYRLPEEHSLFSGRNAQITSQSLARGVWELPDLAGGQGKAGGAEPGCLQTCQPLLCKRNSETKGVWQVKPQMSFEVFWRLGWISFCKTNGCNH